MPLVEATVGVTRDVRSHEPNEDFVGVGLIQYEPLVGLAEAVEWIRAGALAVSVGGPLLGDAFKGGELEQLTARATQLVAAVVEARDGALV